MKGFAEYRNDFSNPRGIYSQERRAPAAAADVAARVAPSTYFLATLLVPGTQALTVTALPD